VLAAAAWTFLFAFSQSKVITINNDGNNSTKCCVEGKCSCGSLSLALHNLESHTIIDIASQFLPLHDHNRIANLTNITISGNGATIMCNNSGNVSILYSSNIVIEGIIWDQCGNTTAQSMDTIGIGLRDISNLTISSCTFQHFGVCIAVFVSVTSGYAQVKNSTFLYNHVINSSRCQWYSSLYFIVDNENFGFANKLAVTDTLFHHNGVFNNITNPSNSTLYLFVNQINQVSIDLVNSTISSSGGLGAYVSCNVRDIVNFQIHDIAITNNSKGGSVLILFGNPLNLAISSSIFANNSNGGLVLVNYSPLSTVLLHRLSIFHNEGTSKIGKEQYFPDHGVDEGVGIVIWIIGYYSTVIISHCNV